jgi:hypothetical protein
LSDKDVAIKLHRRNRAAAIVADTYLEKLDDITTALRATAEKAGKTPEQAEEEVRELRVGVDIVRDMLGTVALTLDGTSDPTVLGFGGDAYTVARLKVVAESTTLPE